MELHPVIYNKMIDPLLSSLRKRIINHIDKDQRVVDIASGTGQLAREISSVSAEVTGVDIEGSMIRYSINKINGAPTKRINFIEADARNLYIFEDKSFDVATMSLALHQFDPDDWNTILTEIIRIADTIIIADYSHPLPAGLKHRIVHMIERIAGKQHYNNFHHFMKSGGVIPIAEKNSLKCRQMERSGSGVFSLYILEKNVN